jgi:hypothetical protein
MFFNFKKSATTLLCIIALFSFLAPQTARAQWAVLDAGNMVQNTLTAISTAGSTISEYYLEYKECCIDPLGWALAKAVLQSMTSDIVDWINGGFEGNPAFVSNPEGFFLNAADQATGIFLSKGGPLSALCSPFSLDIRLSLSLNLAQRQRTRYACTLSTVINNAAKARVNVSADVRLNGQTVRSVQATQSVEGFMGGDFKQGGWGAFTALTTQPQNNIYGAYIQSDSELRATISRNQATINADLSMGNGFMSWEKCEKITSYHQDDEEGQRAGQYVVDTTPDVRIKSGKDGMVNIESCHKETPGSVIGSSLNKQLGIPADALNIADELNEIVSALFSQLVVQVLNGGLLASSEGGAGNAANMANRLRSESKLDVEKHRKNLIEDAEKAATTTEQTLPMIAEAFNLIDTERNSYLAAINCLMVTGAATTSASGNTKYEKLTRVLNEEIEPMYREYKGLYEDAVSNLVTLQQIISDAENAENLAQLMAANAKYTALIRGSSLVTRTAIARAKEDLRRVRNEVASGKEGKPNWRAVLENNGNCSLPAVIPTETAEQTP